MGPVFWSASITTSSHGEMNAVFRRFYPVTEVHPLLIISFLSALVISALFGVARQTWLALPLLTVFLFPSAGIALHAWSEILPGLTGIQNIVKKPEFAALASLILSIFIVLAGRLAIRKFEFSAAIANRLSWALLSFSALASALLIYGFFKVQSYVADAAALPDFFSHMALSHVTIIPIAGEYLVQLVSNNISIVFAFPLFASWLWCLLAVSEKLIQSQSKVIWVPSCLMLFAPPLWAATSWAAAL